jgi:hypothetical protein
MEPNNTQNQWQPEDASSNDAYPTEVYQPEDAGAQDAQAPAEQRTKAELPDETPVTWVAREYIHIDKGVWWYVIFITVALALIAADIFLLKSYTFSVLVVVMMVALIIYIRRPPRDIQYTLSGNQGLYVGERLYHLTDFKSCWLIKDGDNNSIMLIPVKRFAPGVSVYFPEEAGEKIVDILGQRLPMETLKLDMIDILVRKLRL